MNFIKYVLMAVFCTAFFLISCKKSAQIGDDLYPANDLSGAILVDTFTINTFTVLNDSVPTFSATSLLSGNYSDPDLGKISAKSFAQVRLVNFEGIAFGKTPTLDSIVLNLFVDYTYGDSFSLQTINVHRLTEPINSTAYKSNNTLSYEATPLGSKSFTFSANREKIVRIKLSDSLGNELLKMPLSVTQNIDKFTAQLNGIALVPDVNNTTVLGFLLSNNSCNIQLYYKDDTLAIRNVIFPINIGGYRFNSISLDNSNSLISELSISNSTINTTSTNNFGYIQSGTGLRYKLEIPHLKNILNQPQGKLIINKAEIELPVEANVKYLATPLVQVFESTTSNKLSVNSSGIYQSLPADGSSFTTLQSTMTIPFNGNGANKYIIPCTAYIEELLQNNKPNNGLLIVPTSNQVSVTRSKLYGGANSVNKPKLKLYYSILN